MKVFDHPNFGMEVCPVCKKDTDEPVTLVAIDGTEDDGNIACTQVHVTCLNLRIAMMDNRPFLYQVVK